MAAFAWLSSFACDCVSCCICSSSRFFDVATSARLRLTF
jgi:hypothetical protein